MKELEPYQREWIDTVNAGIKLKSKNTQQAYKKDLEQFVRIMGIDLLKAGEKDYLTYFKELEDRGYSYSSIARKITALSVYLDHLVMAGKLQYNPITNIRKVSRLYRTMSTMPDVEITTEDVNRVMVKGGRHIGVIIEFLVNTGLRVSELIGIKHADVIINGQFAKIRIHGKGKKERAIWIEKGLYERITKIFDQDSEYLFHSVTTRPLTRQNIYSRITKAFKRYTGKENIGPHDLRHFFATHHIVDRKHDIKAVANYLGHASVSTTLDMYVNSQLKPEDVKIV